jgi:hypothetical protein
MTFSGKLIGEASRDNLLANETNTWTRAIGRVRLFVVRYACGKWFIMSKKTLAMDMFRKEQ